MQPHSSLYFWEKWPHASQERFHRIVLFGAMVATLSLIVGFKLFAGSLEERISDAKERYAQVVPIVEEVMALRAERGDLAHLSVDKAVWHIVDDLSMEEQLYSLRTTEIDKLTQGVQVTFEGLSLTKLTEFLRTIRDRASLQTPDCTLSRNSDDPRLADAHFILAR